eukprot:UN22974
MMKTILDKDLTENDKGYVRAELLKISQQSEAGEGAKRSPDEKTSEEDWLKDAFLRAGKSSAKDEKRQPGPPAPPPKVEVQVEGSPQLAPLSPVNDNDIESLRTE